MAMKNVVVEVKCPHCGSKRNTQSLKTVECFRCGKSFSVIVRSQNKSRITGIVRGTKQELDKEYYREWVHGNG